MWCPQAEKVVIVGWRAFSKVDTTITLQMNDFALLCSSTVHQQSRAVQRQRHNGEISRRMFWPVGLSPHRELNEAHRDIERGCERLSGTRHLQWYATYKNVALSTPRCRSYFGGHRWTQVRVRWKNKCKRVKTGEEIVIGNERWFYTFITAVNNEWKETAKVSGAQHSFIPSVMLNDCR